MDCAALAVHVGESETWSWVSVSYVCTNWRRVALQSPDLWRYIDFSHPRWYKLTWARAKMSSLHVIATVTENNTRHLQRTLQLAHRIQDIHLISPIEKVRPLLEILAYPNPSLESMTIDIRSSPESGCIDMYDAPSFPTSYGGPPLTNLKYLELRNSPFYLFTSRCTHLTHLHLHNLPVTERPTLRHLLTMLEQLNNLRSLILDHAFPINIEFDDIHDQPICLPQLEYISLVGNVPEISNTLKYIAILPSTHFVCEISTLSDLTPATLHRFAESLSTFARAACATEPLEILALTGHESSSRYTAAFLPNPEYRQSLRIRAFNSGNDAVINLTISSAEQANDDGVITALTSIWNALPLSQVHTIALQDVDIITQASWNAFLGTLPRVRVLTIGGRAPSGLVWALLLNARSSGKRFKGCKKSHRIFMPRLEDIYLHSVDCSSGGYMVSPTAPVNSHRDLDDSRFLDVLIASLHHRRNYAFCLRSLSIARCGFVLKKMVEEARTAVSNLVWDFHSMMKETDVDAAFPARYPAEWRAPDAQLRHYHRLRALIQVDDGLQSVTA